LPGQLSRPPDESSGAFLFCVLPPLGAERQYGRTAELDALYVRPN